MCGIGALTFVDYENPTEAAKALIAKARPMNAAAGTEPKIRYIAKNMDVEAFEPKV